MRLAGDARADQLADVIPGQEQVGVRPRRIDFQRLAGLPQRRQLLRLRDALEPPHQRRTRRPAQRRRRQIALAD